MTIRSRQHDNVLLRLSITVLELLATPLPSVYSGRFLVQGIRGRLA